MVSPYERSDTSLSPSFVQLYYPFLDATPTPSEIFVYVPFKALDTFSAFNILPFPVNISDSLHTLRLPNILTFPAANFLHTVLPTPDFLTRYHSPFHHFPLRPLAEICILQASTNPCVTALIRNSNPQSSCFYAKLQNNMVYHRTSNPWQFFFFPKQASVTVACPHKKNTNLLVHGPYVLYAPCLVKSDVIQLLPYRHYKSRQCHFFLPDLPAKSVLLDCANSESGP